MFLNFVNILNEVNQRVHQQLHLHHLQDINFIFLHLEYITGSSSASFEEIKLIGIVSCTMFQIFEDQLLYPSSKVELC